MNEEETCEFPLYKTSHILETIEHSFLQCSAHNIIRTELYRGFQSLGITERDLKTLLGGNNKNGNKCRNILTTH